MPKPQNPFIAQIRAQERAKYQQLRQCHEEIDLMATLIGAHNELQVGPGRAGFLLAEVLDVKMQIAKNIIEDVGNSDKKGGDGDPEFLYTKKNLAVTLKAILGEENWKRYRELFPMLKDYWEV